MFKHIQAIFCVVLIFNNYFGSAVAEKKKDAHIAQTTPMKEDNLAGRFQM